MRKSVVNLEQSNLTKPVKVKSNTLKKVIKNDGEMVQQHTYTVVKLTGRLTPKVGEQISEKDVKSLIKEQGTTVNITAKKK